MTPKKIIYANAKVTALNKANKPEIPIKVQNNPVTMFIFFSENTEIPAEMRITAASR